MKSVPKLWKRFNAKSPLSPDRFDRSEAPSLVARVVHMVFPKLCAASSLSRCAGGSYNLSAAMYCVVIFTCDDRFADICPLNDVSKIAVVKTSTVRLGKYAALTGLVVLTQGVVSSPSPCNKYGRSSCWCTLQPIFRGCRCQHFGIDLSCTRLTCARIWIYLGSGLRRLSSITMAVHLL